MGAEAGKRMAGDECKINKINPNLMYFTFRYWL